MPQVNISNVAHEVDYADVILDGYIIFLLINGLSDLNFQHEKLNWPKYNSMDHFSKNDKHHKNI